MGPPKRYEEEIPRVRTTDFQLSAERKEALYASGVQAAWTFLAHWNFEDYKALYRSSTPVPTRREQVLLPRVPPTAR